MNNWFKFIWRFLILEAFVLPVLCVCPYEQPQKQFCTSEFVLKVKFREEISSLSFRMELLNVFKGNVNKLTILDNRNINVDISIAYDFTVGNKYIIFGRNEDGYVYSDICHGNRPAEIETKFYRRGLAKFYKRGCDCIVEIPTYTVAKDCHSDYSFLIRRGGNCSWAKLDIFDSVTRDRESVPLGNKECVQSSTHTKTKH